MKLEIDEISGDYLIRLDEDDVYNLEWEEGEDLKITIRQDRMGVPYLEVKQK